MAAASGVDGKLPKARDIYFFMGPEANRTKASRFRNRRRFSAEGESKSTSPNPPVDHEAPNRHEQKHAESAFQMARPAEWGTSKRASDDITSPAVSLVLGRPQRSRLLGEMPLLRRRVKV